MPAGSMGGKRKEIKKRSSGREKKKGKRSILFEWSIEEELKLLKKLVEFSTNNIAHEEFYPFLRNGSLVDVSKIQIFDKIQQLKNKYLEKINKMELHDDADGGDNELESWDDEGFELSKRLWGETAETHPSNGTPKSASKSEALDEWNKSYFENFFDSHGLELHLFTPSFLEATKKEVDQLFCLQNHHFLIKANLKAQLAQLKHHIIQTRFPNNHTNS